MRKQLVVVVAVLTFLLPGVAQAAPAKFKSASLKLDARHTLVVSSPSGSVSLKSRSSGPTVFSISEKRYRYLVGPRSKPVATVWLTVRNLPGGSKVVFSRLVAPRRPMLVTVTLASAADAYAVHPLGMKPDLTYSHTLGVDRTSGPYGWVDLFKAGSFQSDVFLSKAYEFKSLVKTYPRGKTSTVKGLVAERTSVSAGRGAKGQVRIACGLRATKDSCERYFLVTNHAIVDTETITPALVASYAGDEARWLDPYGAYKKSPYSVEPATKVGYVRSLLDMREDGVRTGYALTGSKLFEDLLLNNAYSLSLIRSSDGLWRTDYTSTWVKAESGITAPYIDTRHNEAIGLESMAVPDALDAHGVTVADGMRAWKWPFASFLAQRAAAGAVIPTTNGVYFSDYYDASGLAKCHSSLNHSLGEMEYLLRLCGDTSSTPQFPLAMRIKAAVDDCGTQWIAPNHDLYYQRDMDGSYEETDYPTVTYCDLLQSQQMFLHLLGQTDPTFQALIESKASFLGVTPPSTSSDRSLLVTGDTTRRPFTLPDARRDELP